MGATGMRFKDRLKMLRREAKMTQIDLAEKADIPIDTIRGYEQKTKDRLPGMANLMKMATALGVPVARLTGDDVATPALEIPIIGVAGAGPGRDEPAEPGDTLKLGEVLEGCVAYRVSGDSMEQLGILPGDYVIARPRDRSAKDYPPGTQMVAWVDGAGAMVKEWTGTALRSPDSFRHQVDGLKDDIVGILVAVLRIESSKPKKRRKK